MSVAMLTVWHYDTSMGAAAADVRLKDLQQQSAVRVADAITVTWVPGAEHPHLGHLLRHGPASIARGSMLGALVATLLEDGAAALAGRLLRSGIEEEFLERVTSGITPGASSLLVLCDDVDLEPVRGFVERGLAPGGVQMVQPSLHEGAPGALRALVDPGFDQPGGIIRSG